LFRGKRKSRFRTQVKTPAVIATTALKYHTESFNTSLTWDIREEREGTETCARQAKSTLAVLKYIGGAKDEGRVSRKFPTMAGEGRMLRGRGIKSGR